MKIKDVEKQTGLTAKTIRFYESKGLITVERDANNSYREYSQQEIERLEQIKLFRYLDFSIEEIASILEMDAVTKKEILQGKSEQFADCQDVYETKRKLCQTLAKEDLDNPTVIEEYNATIEFIENDLTETMEELEKFKYPNLAGTIATSLIMLGPILWLFINIKLERQDMLFLNAGLAIGATVLLTLNWAYYITQYRRYRNRVKKNNREWLWTVPVALLAIVLGVALFIGVANFVENLLVTDNFLFYEHQGIAGQALVFLIMIPVILILVILISKIRRKSLEDMEDMNDILLIWNHLGKFRIVAVILWGIAFYAAVTNITVVTEDSIIHHCAFHPMGISYEYSDVKSITTGFGNKKLAITEYKKVGNFYYQIEVDERTITFHTPSTNSEIGRYEDTYLELEEFDAVLTDAGIEKQADEDGYENCDLDQRYVDRFLRIIKNIK